MPPAATAHDIVWPQARQSGGNAGAGAAAPPDAATIAPDARAAALPDPLAFAGALAPELSRLFGHRIGLRPAAADADATSLPLAEVGRLALAPAAGQSGPVLILAIDRGSLCALLDMMFGARPGSGPGAGLALDSLATLSPRSGSWQSVTALLGQALAHALHGIEGAPARAGSFARSPRVAPAAEQPADGLRPQHRLLFRIEIGGLGGLLSLRQQAARTDTAPQGRAQTADPSAHANPADQSGAGSRNWGRRARDFALDLELPVSVEVGEIAMPIGAVAALKPGDILPLERPAAVSVMVAGERLATVPATALHSGHSVIDDAGNAA